MRLSPNPTQPITRARKFDPTGPNPTQPNPWMDPTHVHLCISHYITGYTTSITAELRRALAVVKVTFQVNGNS